MSHIFEHQSLSSIKKLLKKDIRYSKNLGLYSQSELDENLMDLIKIVAQKNLVDRKNYASFEEVEKKLVKLLLHLFNNETGFGFSTASSSEAIFSIVGFYKLTWQEKNRNTKEKPNLIISEAFHNVFEKCALLYDFELRKIPLGKDNRIDLNKAEQAVDKNTFLLVGIAGSTEFGTSDNIEKLNILAKKHDLPLHIDAAIGGMVFPFINKEKIGFNLESVSSLNFSAHKFGQSLPGLGFLLMRDRKMIPQGYKTKMTYISGGPIDEYGILCTKNAIPLISFYYQINKHGIEGYKKNIQENFKKAQFLKKELSQIFNSIEFISNDELPIIIFTINNISAISDFLRKKGWGLNSSEVPILGKKVIRIVVKNSLSWNNIKSFILDCKKANYAIEKNGYNEKSYVFKKFKYLLVVFKKKNKKNDYRSNENPVSFT